ncbi:MAG: protocatechuate 3,4-dioxygenase subunit alpha [Rhizobiaceae bacterium]
MAGKKQLNESPSQTAGPYVHIGCIPAYAGIEGVYKQDIWGNSPVDQAGTTLKVRIFDGDGAPVTDALIEIWIAGLKFWARSAFDEDSLSYPFQIPKTNSWAGQTSDDAIPFISVWIVARGVNIGLHTRIYFPDMENDVDKVLNQVEETRRGSLIANESNDGYTFDIYLQGERETVFFDI